MCVLIPFHIFKRFSSLPLGIKITCCLNILSKTIRTDVFSFFVKMCLSHIFDVLGKLITLLILTKM